MESDVEVKHDGDNPCCSKLKVKYSKVHTMRNKLREAVKKQNVMIDALKKGFDDQKVKADAEKQEKEKLEHEISELKSEMLSLQQRGSTLSQEVDDRAMLQSHILELQAEITRLNELAENNKMEADTERREKEHESGKRVSLEHDVSALKSEILLLQQKASKQAEMDGQVIFLQNCVSELEAEVNMLKECAEKEKMKGDAERQGKENESAKRIELEHEISDLKLKVLSMQQCAESQSKEVGGELFLQSRILELEAEVSALKELADANKLVADSERLEKENESTKRVQLELDMLKLESEVNALKLIAEKEKMVADAERTEKANESAMRVSLEHEISELKSKMISLQQKEALQSQEVDDRVKLLQSHISELEMEITRLKGVAETKSMEADYERQEKAKESTKRESLEHDLSVLKSEILLLQRVSSQVKDKDGEIMSLQTRISESEKEVNGLIELVKKERVKADLERRKAEAEKKKVQEALKNLKVEQSRAAEAKRLADIERGKTMEFEIQLEKYKREADEARSKLDLEAKKHEEANKVLEAERKKADEEKSHANSAMAHAEDQKKSAEIYQKKALEEKDRADSAMAHAAEQKKSAEIYQMKALEEKERADSLSRQLDVHKKTIEELQSALHEFKSGTADLSDKPLNATTNVEGRTGSEILALEQFNTEPVNKKFKEDKQKRVKKRKRVDSERNKAEDEGKQSQPKKFDALEAILCADEVDHQLADKTRRMKVLQKEISELVTYRTLVKDPKSMNSETFEIEMLRKQLELEKQQVKHAKEVAKFEIGRNNMLQQEMGYLRQEFVRSLQHLDSLNNVFSPGTDRGDLGKDDNVIGTSGLSLRTRLLSKELRPTRPYHDNELVRPSCTATDVSDNVTKATEYNGPTLFTSGGNSCKCISGIDSNLEPLLGGSNRMLQNSSINSSTTSFSDRPLMGSQGRCAFSVAPSDRLAEEKSNSQRILSNQSVEGTNNKCNENLAVVAENNIRGGIIKFGDIERGGHSKKKKRILDTVKSIEELYSVGKKWHLQLEEKLSLLRCTLNSQVNKFPLEKRTADVQEGHQGEKKARAPKKRKVSVEDESALCCSRGVKDQEKAPEGRGIEGANQISDFGSDQRRITQLLEDGLGDLGKSSLEHWVISNGVVEGDYLKLLDMDTEVDEERYRSAIERPLSPTLPVIECRKSEAIPRYCVVSSNIKDSRTIGRILDAAGAYMHQCSTVSQIEEVMQKIVPPLLLSEDLSLKEKSCVLFSVLLLNLSEKAVHKSANLWSVDFIFLLDSFARYLKKVISEVKMRGVFAELCTSGELLTLVEDFLLDRRVLFYGTESSKSLAISGSRINIPPDEVEVPLPRAVVRSHHLVAASLILASICEAMDHTGFLCEASYNVLRMQKLDISLILTILHVFAYVSGSKYFSHNKHSSLVTVVRSLVTFLEKRDCTSEYTCCLEFSDANPSQRPLNCPFSETAVSVDDAVSLLFGKLQRFARHGIGSECSLESVDPLNSGTQLNSFDDKDLYSFTDLISLVELIACKMSWDWTCNNILSQTLTLLDLPLSEKFSIVSVILLDKLGRLGVDSNGHLDKGVVKLKSSLSAFLSEKIPSSRLGLPCQIATVNAVLGLVPAGLKEIVCPGPDHLSPVREADPSVDCIRRWYSGLSSEERSVSLSLL